MMLRGARHFNSTAGIHHCLDWERGVFQHKGNITICAFVFHR